jgi:predicted amidophosphoribosyltransferase
MPAHAVGRRARVFVDCFALKRVGRTASQVGLSADQRCRNVAGAFKLPQAETGRIKG